MADGPNTMEQESRVLEAEARPTTPPPPPEGGEYRGTGRRKSAIARVRIIPGDGQFLINDRPMDKYFTELQEHQAVNEPLQVTNTLGKFRVLVRVSGGGHTGQAGAVRMGLARALVAANTRYEPFLRDRGLLTRDSRIVERKKYGRRKARRRFQFSKR